MKVIHKLIESKIVPTLACLKINDTFMFVEYDLQTGPFLVIDHKGYCRSIVNHPNKRRFVLNLALNTIHHRTVTAKIVRVNCVIIVK